MQNSLAPGKLFLVATPIGHLKDITLRAIETLKDVDLIAAEDTRRSKVLLDEYGIQTKMVPYHAHNETLSTKKLIALLNQGKHIALISDAGTPVLSDPGLVLVKEAIQSGISVIPIPGPSSVITALCASGLAPLPFLFLGFLPAKAKARQALLNTYAAVPYTVICFEAPHRLLEMLEECRTIFTNERRIVIARELTKTFETFYSGTVEEVLLACKADPYGQSGEFVILIEGFYKTTHTFTLTPDAMKLITALTNQGIPKPTIAKIIAELYEVARNEVYAHLLK